MPLVLLSLLLGTLATATLPARSASAATVGAGSYTTTLPAGAALPSGCADLSTDPRRFVTDDAPSGPVPTNDWWSALLFKRWDCSYGEPMMAHPAAYDTVAGGLGVSYTTTPVVTGTATGVSEYKFPYQRDVLVGVDGLAAPEVEVAGWSDWTVTPRWSDGTRTMRATIGHGLPMSYYTMSGGDALLSTDATPTVWRHDGAQLGFTVRGHDYVGYAPSGATWTVSGSTFRSTLAGRGYLTVAVLPTTAASSDAERTALATSYGRYAHAVVTGSTLSYDYDPANAEVTARYGLTTTPREGTERNAVVSLYPHQWRVLAGGSPIAQRYVSPRGAMKTLVGVGSFTTVDHFRGVLPELPAVATGAGADRATLDGYLDQVKADPMGQQQADTYWTGKALGRAARIAEIADQVGRTDVRDVALARMRASLEDWFTASAGEPQNLFYYDRNWGTLIGYAASYGSDAELNDHHFHYGYYVAAAAVLARFDPAWAADGRWGGMVDLLVRDANNYDRDDTRFPYLRDFDIYAGHDWASGHGAFAAGNNQESSSEGMNFAGALVQWGQATGDTAVRDAGVYLYTTQAAAIADYWFDVHDEVYPAAFGHGSVGMVWGDGGAYSTWFSAEPEKIQGINQLPITGSHLYLGYHPEENTRSYAELVRNAGREPSAWQDILWEYLALGDPDAALAKFRAGPGYAPEEGESRAHTFHWLANLAALGTLDTSVTAGSPTAVAFTRDGRRSYVVANLTGTATTVTFTDGTSVAVRAGGTVVTGAQRWSGGGAGGGSGGTDDPGASPSPSATPTSTPSATPTSSPAAGLTRYLRSDGGLREAADSGDLSVAAARGEYVAAPHEAVTFTATGLTGRWTGGATGFDLALDAGRAVGNAVQVRVAYDLTGDGSTDRVETYRYVATDDRDGREHYTEAAGLSGSTGALGDLRNGSVRVTVWNALGQAPTALGVGDSSVLRLPYR